MSPDCSALCPVESVGKIRYSSPIVNDQELICRGAYSIHYRNGRLRSSFVERKTLQAGELSVWRCPSLEGVPQLADKLVNEYDRVDRTLEELFSLNAGQLRTLRLDVWPSRIFCVINDTRVDYQGKLDEQHAAIAVCQEVIRNSAVDIEHLQNLLQMTYRQNRVWAKAA